MKKLTATGILFTALTTPLIVNAYESGSTGADGVFSPATNIQVTLPPSGIFNYTDVNIPAGVSVTFVKNANNTPVVILASGDVTIDGIISVNGTPGTNSIGVGGPGGFNGGIGGLYARTPAGDGQGPGRGTGSGLAQGNNNSNGGSGGFGTPGLNGTISGTQGRGGPAYGEASLRTLIGGSGGGGEAGNPGARGGGGGGGGGAILIAASGTITVNGNITARGGSSPSGGGSGGAIRLVATTLQGEGVIAATGGGGEPAGGSGRIRLEAESFLRASDTTPGYSISTPFPAFYANVPTVRITSIGGQSAPASPTGFRDVVLAGVTTNPVTVAFETTNIPLGTTITLSAAPERGAATTVTSTAVAGSIALGTATASIDLPNGNSTLFGQAAFTINITSNLDINKFSKYAQGEKVEKVRVNVDTDGKSETTFITASGKEFTWPSNAVAMN